MVSNSHQIKEILLGRGAAKLGCNLGTCDSAMKSARQQPCCAEPGSQNIGLYIRKCPIWLCVASNYMSLRHEWMYLFVWLFGPLHHGVLHSDTGLRKQLENWGTREKCNMSTATLAEAKWAGTAIWPHNTVSQRFPKWPRQLQYLLPSIINFQLLSLKGYWCWDQLLNSVRSVFTSFLQSLNTKFCCMRGP